MLRYLPMVHMTSFILVHYHSVIEVREIFRYLPMVHMTDIILFPFCHFEVREIFGYLPMVDMTGLVLVHYRSVISRYEKSLARVLTS